MKFYVFQLIVKLIKIFRNIRKSQRLKQRKYRYSDALFDSILMSPLWQIMQKGQKSSLTNAQIRINNNRTLNAQLMFLECTCERQEPMPTSIMCLCISDHSLLVLWSTIAAYNLPLHTLHHLCKKIRCSGKEEERKQSNYCFEIDKDA